MQTAQTSTACQLSTISTFLDHCLSISLSETAVRMAQGNTVPGKSNACVKQCYGLKKVELGRSHGATARDRHTETLLVAHDLVVMHRLMEMG